MIFNLLDAVNKILALGTIIAQVFMILAVIYFFVPCKTKPKVCGFFSKNAVNFAFVVALISTVGSLFYSTYAGFVPCSLCWFQRIFMYPEVIILGLAILKNDKRIVDYVLSLSVIGLIFSVYHNYIYIKSLSSTFCTISEPCTVAYVLEFHYVSIPMMALTAFLTINLLLILGKYYDKK